MRAIAKKVVLLFIIGGLLALIGALIGGDIGYYMNLLGGIVAGLGVISYIAIGIINAIK